jgi:hypothetical protein
MRFVLLVAGLACSQAAAAQAANCQSIANQMDWLAGLL